MNPEEKARYLYLMMRSEIEYLDGTEAHKDMRAKVCAKIALHEFIQYASKMEFFIMWINNNESQMMDVREYYAKVMFALDKI